MEVDFTLSVGALPYHELLVDLAATEAPGHRVIRQTYPDRVPPCGLSPVPKSGVSSMT